MIKRTKFLINILPLASLLLLAACSQNPKVQDFPDTADPREEVSRLERDLQSAKENQFDVLSPENFDESFSSLQDAKKYLEKKDKNKEVLQNVALSRSYLAQANKIGLAARAQLEGVIATRTQAMTANAPQIFPSEFKSIDQDLRNITEDFEENNSMVKAEDKDEIQVAYLDLELLSIKHKHLNTPKNLISQAESEEALKYAPRTFAIAQKSIQDTEAYITSNRNQTDLINERAMETLKKSEHALLMAKNAKARKNISFEDTALQIESKENKLLSSQQAVDKGLAQNEELSSKNSVYQSNENFQRLYEDARAQFSKSEADVYKQGNTLVIRLKGLDFPSSQADLKSSNFPLLAKVKKVIESFNNSRVTIEGHTDAMGGKELNQKLSTERAKAVEQYFASNSNEESIKMESIGYGFQKPLATNKTPQGRAQNRRVDILIQPNSSQI